MAEIVKGLFGIDPQSYQEDRLAQKRAEAMQYARLDPFQKATTAIYQGAQQGVEAGLNMMGVKDPELQAQQVASELASKFDLSSAEGMAEYSRALGQKAQETGLPALNEFSNMAGQRALVIQQTLAKTKKTAEETRLMGREFETYGVEGNPELIQKAVIDKDGNIIAKIGDPYSRFTNKSTSNVNLDVKMLDVAAGRRDRFITENKPIIEQGAAVQQGLTLAKQDSAFSEAALENTLATAFGGDKQKSKQEINRLINTGSLDERITNSLSKFATGKTSEMTQQDRINVLEAVQGDLKRRYTQRRENTIKSAANVKELAGQEEYMAPTWQEMVGGGAAAGKKAYTVGQTINDKTRGVLKVTKVDGAGNPIEVMDSKGNIGTPAQGAK